MIDESRLKARTVRAEVTVPKANRSRGRDAKPRGSCSQPGRQPMSLVLRITFATLLAAPLVIAAGVAEAKKHRAPARARAAQQCADADLRGLQQQPAPRSAPRSLCLHNQVRAEYHQPPLRENKTPAAGRRSATRATW